MLEQRRPLPRWGRDRGCGSRNGLLGQGQLLARQVRLPPVNGTENGEMEGSAENIEGGGSELASHWCSVSESSLFLLLLSCREAELGMLSHEMLLWFPSHVTERTLAWLEGQRLTALPMNVSAWLGVALRSFGISVSTQLPARLCAALERSRVLRACVPCQEVYSTFGKTTGILSLTSVSWQ